MSPNVRGESDVAVGDFGGERDCTSRLREEIRSPQEPQWNGFAQQLHDAAMAAKRAATTRDKDALLRTGGDIYAACTACHKRYVLGEK